MLLEVTACFPTAPGFPFLAQAAQSAKVMTLWLVGSWCEMICLLIWSLLDELFHSWLEGSAVFLIPLILQQA